MLPKVFIIFVALKLIIMTTTISIPTEDDAIWDQHDSDVVPYTYEELQTRIDEGEAQFERGEYKSHEQLMSELQEEYPWLK